MNIRNKTISRKAMERAAGLLEQLSLEEKLRQLGCTMLSGTEEPLEEKDLAGGIGEIALLDIRIQPKELARRLREVQEYVMNRSPHRIPALFHCEALSGPVAPGCVLYPTSIGLGATFHPELVREMAGVIRRQMRAMGILHALSPVLDVAGDLRWGRVNETYGGDPTLSAMMACAFTEGLQGQRLEEGVAATAKHFLGYSRTAGGLNLTRTLADRRELREVYAKPFEAAIRKSGIRTVMNSYSEWEGRPICASRELLTDLLRGQLGFEGLVVSDYRSIQRLLGDILATAEDITGAAAQCLEAGLDMELPDRLGYHDALAEAFREGRLDETILDRSVLRVLTLKFELGLFDDPFPQWERYSAAFPACEEQEQQAARESLILAKNEGGLLPIRDKNSRVAVIGPGGGSLRLLYGGYTLPSMLEMFQVVQDASAMAGLTDGKAAPQPARKYDLEATDQAIRQARPQDSTIYEALCRRFPHCTYTQGCDYLDPSVSCLDAARAAAREADYAVVCVSGKNGWGRHCTTGEGNDDAFLRLSGAQEELVQAVLAENPRTVVIHTDGRPMVSEWIYESAPAIVEALAPGGWGGEALAGLLAGEFSPAGRFPLDLPRSVGHGPLPHWEHCGSTGESFAAGSLNRDGYLRSRCTPLRPFGFGLSYTQFRYQDFHLHIAPNGSARAEVTVENTGPMEGDEVVQLYGRDCLASYVRPAQELVGVCRLSLRPGERKRVVFSFQLNQFAFPDACGVWRLEAGDFQFFTGGSSADRRAGARYTLPCTRRVEPEYRGFFAEAQTEQSKP